MTSTVRVGSPLSAEKYAPPTTSTWHRPPRPWSAGGWLHRSVVALTVLAMLATGVRYLVWRTGPARAGGPLADVFLVAEFASFAFLALTALLLTRVRRREPLPMLSEPTLDVFVTACGEPPEMVERTLRAAVGISYPHSTFLLSDNAMAGYDPEPLQRIAARLGVTSLTRRTGARGKAGNLNHGLALTGSELVLTLDADHVAEPHLGPLLLPPFQDDRVAFVASRQRVTTPHADVLNNSEPLFYNGLQRAKDVDGCAFSCGNATVYRRSALDSVGGFSEWNLVEDLHTSYLLHAGGWRSVYCPTAVTTGTAPATAAVYARQRFVWAADSLRLLLLDNPLRRRGLSWRQRLHYLHTTISYLSGCLQLVFLVGPMAWVLFRVPVISPPDQRTYLLEAGPYFASTLLLLALFAGPAGALRTVRGAMFTAPVHLAALAHVLRRRVGERRWSGVTPKSRQPRMSALLLGPLLCFGLLGATLMVGAVDARPGRSLAALLWAVGFAALLVPPLTVAEVRRSWSRGFALVALTAIAAVFVVSPQQTGDPAAQVIAGDRVPTSAFVLPDTARPAPRVPIRKLAVPTTGGLVGVAAPTLPWQDGAQAAWTASRGVSPAIVNWFQQWRSGETRLRTDWLDSVSAAGAVPMITWEPWAKPEGSYQDADQPAAKLSLITSGAYDDYIRAWGKGLAAYRRPVLLRFLQEGNGWWYPWSVGTNGNTAADYVAAWRHVHALVVAQGATNVSWVWSVNTLTGLTGKRPPLASFFPGADVVDWVATSGFNWGTSTPWGRWTSPATLLDTTITQLSAFGLPIMVSEVGTTSKGGDPGAWLHQAFTGWQRNPAVRAVVLFDSTYSKGIDFTLGPSARQALHSVVTTSPYWAARPD